MPVLRVTLILICMAVSAVAASAQPIELVGARALGMGGAFVAVADDATAAYWNPAGLAFGALFSTMIDRTELEAGTRDGPEMPQLRASSTFVGFGALPFAVSYTRLSETTARIDLNADPSASVLESLETDHVGITLVQSILSDLAIGTTLKVVRGRAAHGVVTDPGADPIQAAEDLDSRGSTAFDLDVGAMAAAGALRLGIVVRNVREPTFEAPDGVGLSLQRQTRVGAAVVVRRRWTVAVDADLERVESAVGPRRDVSAGVERWLLDHRLGLRGGVRVNTAAEETHAVGSLGASLHVTPTFAIDGHWADSEAPADRSWGLAGRVTF